MKKLMILTAIIGMFLLAIPAQAQMKTVVSLTGSVFDSETRQPVKVRMEAYNEKGKRKAVAGSNAKSGNYFLTGLRPGHTYTIRFVGKAYFSYEYEVTIPKTDKYAEYSKDYLLTPKKQGLKIPLAVSPFELHKSKLRAGADFFLSDILKTLTKNPRIKFEIVSFPDDMDDMVANKKLTNSRSKALMAYLTENSIDASRMTSKGIAMIDPDNPLPTRKQAKGKRYIGRTYIVIKEI
ncbi:MAG: OmpA family protein [Chlorobi bacterium]|nr:OmpA family protein [Chlorobiota bacterium]